MPDQVVLTLSFVAALAILPGLLRRPAGFPAGTAGGFLLSGLAGLLGYVVWDLFAHGFLPVTGAIEALRDRLDDATTMLTLGALFLAGVALAFGLLMWRDADLDRAEVAPAEGGRHSVGPGTVAAAELTGIATPAGARRRAMVLAAGLGLHGVLVGLAIGSNGERDEIAFTCMLAIAAGLYALAQGYLLAGIFREGTRLSLATRLLMALIVGASLFLATLGGMYLTEDEVTVGLCGLAGGALAYAALRLVLGAAERHGKRLVMWGVLAGLLVGFVGDILLITFAGSVD